MTNPSSPLQAEVLRIVADLMMGTRDIAPLGIRADEYVVRLAAQMRDRARTLSGHHKSDCAIHNAPAYPPGPCDCGAALSAVTMPPELCEWPLCEWPRCATGKCLLRPCGGRIQTLLTIDRQNLSALRPADSVEPASAGEPEVCTCMTDRTIRAEGRYAICNRCNKPLAAPAAAEVAQAARTGDSVAESEFRDLLAAATICEIAKHDLLAHRLRIMASRYEKAAP